MPTPSPVLTSDPVTKYREQINNLIAMTPFSGKSVIATPETLVLSTTYAVATTPDRVSGVVVPASGVLIVRFSGFWTLNDNDARAAIFVGGNQLKLRNPSGAPTVQEVSGVGGLTGWIYTAPNGLTQDAGASAGSVVTTGTVRSGALEVDVDAGTYVVEVRYRSVSGAASVAVKERKLFVESRGF